MLYLMILLVNGSNISATGTFTGGLVTAPVASNTATAAYGTTLTAGTSLRNTTGYDILVNICATVASATGATLLMGVGSTSSPVAQTVVQSFTTAVSIQFTFSAIVPNNYYLIVTDTGTISLTSLT